MSPLSTRVRHAVVAAVATAAAGAVIVTVAGPSVASGASPATAGHATVNAATQGAARVATPAKRPVSKVDRIILTGGGTALTLDPGTAAVLAKNKIAVAPTGEALVQGTSIVFPITGGLIKPQTLAGTVTHAGGLTFTAGGKSLTVRDFTIDTGKKQLLAYVDELKTTVPLLDLNLAGLKTTLTGANVTLAGVEGTLTAAAAGALDTYYGTTLFTAGLPIGSATTSSFYVGVLVNR